MTTIEMQWTFKPKTYTGVVHGFDRTVFILQKEPSELKRRLARAIGVAGRHVKKQTFLERGDAMFEAVGSFLTGLMGRMKTMTGRHESDVVSDEVDYVGRHTRVEEASSEESQEAATQAS